MLYIAALPEAGSEEVCLAPQSADGQLQFPPQLGEVLTAAVLQFPAFEKIPDALVGIEVRRVAGEAFEMQPRGRAGRQEVLDRLAVVNGGTVPDHQQLPSNLAQELAEKGDDRRSAEGLVLHMREEPAVGGDSADHREMVVREWGAQDGRLADRCIGARDERQQIEARFIYEEDGALLLLGFAKRAGQVSSHHACTFASSRSRARWIGFWTLNPSCRSSRLRWAG